ncbi:uncharacterized protein ColSpa_02832 [Colletotrichum spaethianum]|uniref:Uncharacterized protein n=1 Tax=Colletotrichum spaethianum TaxID=700344 RepID=A0AA37P518_9PEZI|nr:uncharacterized protein ColSpa_02832 [Colletotrichum spaethianum]GKT42651.1 hypothetical protein ColSpa_02832 [Colletotrichum spaethianum]
MPTDVEMSGSRSTKIQSIGFMNWTLCLGANKVRDGATKDETECKADEPGIACSLLFGFPPGG